jgi:hypothetical protein
MTAAVSIAIAGALAAFAYYRPGYGWPTMAGVALWWYLIMLSDEAVKCKDALDRILVRLKQMPNGSP